MLRLRAKKRQRPSLFASIIPLVVLSVLLYTMLSIFGDQAMDGANQVALLSASAVGAAIAIGVYHQKWNKIEDAIIDNIRTSGSSLIILLLIGALTGCWMLSGIIPTMIYYGLQVLNPSILLASSCVICAVVSIMTGSSWTTIATIGIALMGIGTAHGFSPGWIAGAIISGAYFGDKLSMLSDTTVMASTTVGVNVFEHIKYMLITTIPSIIIALIVFTLVGLFNSDHSTADIDIYLDTLSRTFHISPWLMVVPLITGFMISRRLPAIITLFTATLCAAVAMWWTQSDIMAQIAEVAPAQLDATAKFTAIIKCCYGATAIETQYSDVTDLISTRGMEGMLNTIWLIICAMCFGGVLNGSGMLKRVTSSLLRMGKRTTTTVGSTVIGGVCFNLCTADQYISIILTGKLFKELYSKNGFEARLLSRSVEDSASVTSVLVPWNSCGMTQATVLGVATWVYLPYCIFNLVSPISSFIVAAIGYKIYRKTSNLKDATDGTDSDI